MLRIELRSAKARPQERSRSGARWIGLGRPFQGARRTSAPHASAPLPQWFSMTLAWPARPRGQDAGYGQCRSGVPNCGQRWRPLLGPPTGFPPPPSGSWSPQPPAAERKRGRRRLDPQRLPCSPSPSRASPKHRGFSPIRPMGIVSPRYPALRPRGAQEGQLPRGSVAFARAAQKRGRCGVQRSRIRPQPDPDWPDVRRAHPPLPPSAPPPGQAVALPPVPSKLRGSALSIDSL